MPTNQDKPTLNDRAPSWANIVANFTVGDGGALLETIDFAALNWSWTITRGEQRGASGGRVMKRTSGSVAYEASVTFYRSGYDKLLTALAAKAASRGDQKLIGDVEFDILVMHRWRDSGPLYQVLLKGCLLAGDSEQNAEGDDPNKVECALSVLEIERTVDGQKMVPL